MRHWKVAHISIFRGLFQGSDVGFFSPQYQYVWVRLDPTSYTLFSYWGEDIYEIQATVPWLLALSRLGNVTAGKCLSHLRLSSLKAYDFRCWAWCLELQQLLVLLPIAPTYPGINEKKKLVHHLKGYTCQCEAGLSFVLNKVIDMLLGRQLCDLDVLRKNFWQFWRRHPCN